METSLETAKDLLEVAEHFSIRTELRSKCSVFNPNAFPGRPWPSKEIQRESHLLSFLLIKALLPGLLPDLLAFFGKD